MYRDRTFLARTVTSIILALLVYLVIFFTDVFVYTLITILFASLSLGEFYKLLEKKYSRVYTRAGILASFVLFLACLTNLEYKYFIYLLFFSIILLFLYQFTKRSNENACLALSLTIFGLIYITIPFLFLIKLRFLNDGPYLIAYFIVVTKATDIGAYLVGRSFGRHPLIPRISPKKSIEGFIGGIISSLLLAYLGALYIPIIFMRHVPGIGLILGIFAQVGDLIESVFKRDVGVKDSEKTIPGLGGILDLVDSLLLSLPFYYLYIDIFVLK